MMLKIASINQLINQSINNKGKKSLSRQSSEQSTGTSRNFHRGRNAQSLILEMSMKFLWFYFLIITIRHSPPIPEKNSSTRINKLGTTENNKG